MGYSRGLPATDLAAASAAVCLLLLGYFALGQPELQERLARCARESRSFPWLAVACLTVPYLAYSLPMHSF